MKKHFHLIIAHISPDYSCKQVLLPSPDEEIILKMVEEIMDEKYSNDRRTLCDTVGGFFIRSDFVW